MLLKVIWQSSGESETLGVFSQTINQVSRVGDKQFVNPSILWNNGKTFLVGDKGNASFLNQIIGTEFNHDTKEFYYTDIGDGAGYFDAYDHPVPYIWIENDYIYSGQAYPHNGPISLFKSNSPNTMKQGFTQLTDIPGIIAYEQIFKDINGNTSIFIRKYTPFDNLSFDIAIKVGDGTIEGTFVDVSITDVNTAGYRIYNGLARPYGVNTINYFAGSRRNDGGSPKNYFAYLVTKTSNYSDFANANSTHTKDVVATSGLTDTELDDYYTINGSLADDTQDLSHMNCISVNNVFYGIGKKAVTEVMTIWKIENDLLTSYTVDIPDIFGNFYNPFLYYNGQNILVSCLTNDGTPKKEIWAVPLDVSSFTQKYIYSDSVTVTAKPILLPDNLDIVTGQYLMFIKLDGTTGYFYETDDKFYL